MKDVMLQDLYFEWMSFDGRGVDTVKQSHKVKFQPDGSVFIGDVRYIKG